MRRLLERLAQVNPWRYADPDRESVKCTFCGAPALAGTELAGRFHLDGCVWSDARRYLDEHPQQ